MTKRAVSLKKLLYALFFVIVVPVILWFWAERTKDLVELPPVQSFRAGWILIASGGILMFWGMVSIVKFGKGLPTNYKPPKEFVQKGPYKIVAHPIYWGFGILLVGFFILTKSASGLWLVAPITIMAMWALVLGYENFDLKHRFPKQKLTTFFDFPSKENTRASIKLKISVFLRFICFLLVFNYLIQILVGNKNPLFEVIIPTNDFSGIQWIELINLVLVFITPFLIQTSNCLRKWNFMMLISLSLGLFISLLFPSVGAQVQSAEPIEYQSLLPPVFLVLVSLKSLRKSTGRVFYPLVLILVLPMLAQLEGSKSFLLSIIYSLVVFLFASNYKSLWEIARYTSEKIANSWVEWTFGNIRVINHGFYVGFAAFAGLLAGGILVGKEYTWIILVFSIVVIIVSALWAQIIEGSEKLKRPFGYYGGLAGMIFASITVWVMGYDVWIIVGTCTIFLPWAQAIGRLRCLVNGCCHGGKVHNHKIGIRFWHFRSRVCGISGLKGEYLHPTQLYSIIWLFFIGFLFFVLWNKKAPPSFILGLYLILSGIGRFVEEAFRGEVQTPLVNGLRLYQWTAVITFILGIAFTLIPSQPILIEGGFDWEILLAALIVGFITFFAMGVDFPNSNARFSRLV